MGRSNPAKLTLTMVAILCLFLLPIFSSYTIPDSKPAGPEEESVSSSSSYPLSHTMTLYPGPSQECMDKKTLDGLEPDEQELLVSLHNSLREKYAGQQQELLQLQWNEELASIAQRWADQCMFAHDVERGMSKEEMVGQYVFLGYTRVQDSDGEEDNVEEIDQLEDARKEEIVSRRRRQVEVEVEAEAVVVTSMEEPEVVEVEPHAEPEADPEALDLASMEELDVVEVEPHAEPESVDVASIEKLMVDISGDVNDAEEIAQVEGEDDIDQAESEPESEPESE